MNISGEMSADLIRIAHVLADAARKISLLYFRSSSLVSVSKGAGLFDPVTDADRQTELRLRTLLTELRPGDGIIGEEYGITQGTSGLVWTIDPVDGTRGFISGTPTWGTLVSVSDENGPLYGLIDQPYIGERFEGGFGLARMISPRGETPLVCRARSSFGDAILFSTFPEIGTKEELLAFRRVSEKVQLTRYGHDCYAYALLAAGHIDLVIEAGVKPYDIHAPIAVITSAGGIVTDWNGNPCHDGGQIIAAANTDLHTAALKLLQNT